MSGLWTAPRRFAPVCIALCLALASCDSGPEAPPVVPPVTPPVTPPVKPPVEPPVEPPVPAAFSVSVLVRDASGLPVAGLPVEIQFFPDDASGAARAPALHRGAPSFEVGDISPTPFQSSASAVIRQDAPLFGVQADLVDVAGVRRRSLYSGDLAAGTSRFAFPAQGDDDQDLPGGIYAVRVIADADTVLRYTIFSDAFFDGKGDFGSIGRALGRTDATGRISTSDRTAAPGLFIDGAEIVLTSEQGFIIGSVAVGQRVAVVVRSEGGRVLARTVVTLRDTLNEIDLRVDGDE